LSDKPEKYTEKQAVRTALHFQRRARVVRQDEDRHMVGRIRAPPALPLWSGPAAITREPCVSDRIDRLAESE